MKAVPAKPQEFIFWEVWLAKRSTLVRYSAEYITTRKRVTVAKRVLVVEDNELNLKLFCDLLRAHGFVVEPVKDGREVLDKARSFVPNLIIMDIQLPHVSGLELIEQIKKDPQLKIIPIMAVTAYAGKGDEDRILTAGAEAYVSKPISVAKFIESVQKVLHR